jgi:hypothetical protein
MNWNNKKVSHVGFSFASKLEAAVYDILKSDALIKEIQPQDIVYLTDARILYKPDFKCLGQLANVFWVEAKGYETPEWRIKRRLWMHYGPGPLYIYMGSHTRPTLKEVLSPK